MGGVQIVVVHPQHHRVPLGRAVLVGDELMGVGTQQVVEDEPAGGVLDEQARPGELGQQGADLSSGHPGQRGGHGVLMSGPGCSAGNRKSTAASLIS